jgi:hypothetical protein
VLLNLKVKIEKLKKILIFSLMATIIDLTSQDTMTASTQLVRMRAAIDANIQKTIGGGGDLNAGAICLIPKGQRPFFGLFLEFGQPIVDAILVQKISNFW